MYSPCTAHAVCRMILRLFVLGVSLGSLSRCTHPSTPELVPIEARVSQLFPRSADLDASSLFVKVEIYNPRSTPITVEKLDFVLDTKNIGGVVTGERAAGEILESEQQGELGFEIHVPIQGGVKTLANLYTSELYGQLTGEVLLSDGSKTSFAYRADLTVPALPRVEVHEAKAKLKYEGVDVRLVLRVVNENPFAVTVRSVDFTVDLLGQQVSKETMSVGSRLRAGAAEELTLDLLLDDTTPIKLATILDRESVNYLVQGEITTHKMSVPFKLIGEIPLPAP